MAVTILSYPGQANSTGATDALFLKVFSGEVLQAFETSTVMKPLHTVRTISNGKSAQFPVTGIANAFYHTPGDDIASDGSYLSKIPHNEKIINIDKLLVASTFIDKLDEAKNHYDVRSIYSSEIGRSLAKAMDKNLIGVALNTAATWTAATPAAITPVITGQPSSTIITDVAFNETGKPDIPTSGMGTFVTKLYDMAAEFDVKNVPSADRYVVTTPVTYYRLINSTAGKELINRDYNPSASASFAKANLPSIAGFTIVPSNNAAAVFGTTVAANSGQNNTYTGIFTRAKALAFHKSAFGTVKLLDLAMESEYDIRLQGHLMVAKYAMGHGSLRHECAGVIASTG